MNKDLIREAYQQGVENSAYYLKKYTPDQIKNIIKKLITEVRELKSEENYDDAAILQGELAGYRQAGFDAKWW